MTTRYIRETLETLTFARKMEIAHNVGWDCGRRRDPETLEAFLSAVGSDDRAIDLRFHAMQSYTRTRSSLLTLSNPKG